LSVEIKKKLGSVGVVVTASGNVSAFILVNDPEIATAKEKHFGAM
jgi:hypothetical protein